MSHAILRAGRHRDGPEIIVDEADLPLVGHITWSISTKRGSHTRYAINFAGGKRHYLHRLLINPPEGMEVDHIDGNGLNNTRANLRVVTRSENIRSAYSLPGRFSKPRQAIVLNRVKRTLADGTVKEYVYDRVSGKRVR